MPFTVGGLPDSPWSEADIAILERHFPGLSLLFGPKRAASLLLLLLQSERSVSGVLSAAANNKVPSTVSRVTFRRKPEEGQPFGYRHTISLRVVSLPGLAEATARRRLLLSGEWEHQHTRRVRWRKGRCVDD